MFWAILKTIVFALAATAILINRQAWLALRLMTVRLALFGVVGLDSTPDRSPRGAAELFRIRPDFPYYRGRLDGG